MNSESPQSVEVQAVIDASGQGSAFELPAESSIEGIYCIGRKASEADDFELPMGFAQIRALFAVIGNRAGLDLYQ